MGAAAYGASSGDVSASVQASGFSSYSFDHAVTAALDASQTGSSTLHQEGGFSGFDASLSCLLADQESTHSYVQEQTGTFTADGTSWSRLTLSSTADSSAAGGGRSQLASGSFTQSSFHSASFADTFTFASRAEGTGSSTQHQEGRYAGGSYHLDSVTDDATGSDSQSYHHQSLHQEDGVSRTTLTRGDTGLDTLSYQYGAAVLGHSASETSHDSAAYHDASSSSYDEQAESSFQLHQEGRFGNHSYSLDSVLFHAAGSQSHTFHEQATFTESGSGVRQASGSTDSGLFDEYAGHEGNVSDLDSFTSTATYGLERAHYSSLDVTGAGSVSLHQEGQFAGGAYALSSVVFHTGSSDSFQAHEHGSDSQEGASRDTTSGSGSQLSRDSHAQGGVSLAGSASYTTHESYTYTAARTYTLDRSGLSSATLHQEGQFADHSFSLSSVLLHSGEISDSFVYRETGTFAHHGDGWSRQSSTGDAGNSWIVDGTGNSATDSHSFLELSTYSFGETVVHERVESGTASVSLHQEGQFAAGSYSLGSVLFQAGRISPSFAYHEEGEATRDGTSSSTATGSSTQAETGLSQEYEGLRVDGERYVHGSQSSFSSTLTYVLDQEGNSSFALRQEGSYGNHSFAFASVVYREGTTRSTVYGETYSSESAGTSPHLTWVARNFPREREAALSCGGTFRAYHAHEMKETALPGMKLPAGAADVVRW